MIFIIRRKIMKTWMTYGYDKIVTDMPAPSELKKSFSLSLTKGGKETCQFVVNSDTDTAISVKPATPGVKCNVYYMPYTVTIDGHQHTDPIIPYNGETVEVKAGISLPFFLEFESVEAGDYAASFEISENGSVEILTVALHVWNFALPTEKAFATACGININNVKKYDQSPDVYKTYYEFFVENGLSPHKLPYDFLDDRADEYMSDPRVTSFVLPHDEDERVIACTAKIRSNPDWHKKALFYSIDEPHTYELIESFKQKVTHLRSLAPDIPSIVPIFTNLQMGEGKDQFEEMLPYLDMHCPKLCFWDDDRSYGRFLDYTPEKTFKERIDEVIDGGQRVWSYVCNSPNTPYSQLYIDTDGLMQRLLIWQHYQRRIVGFLYWGVTYWVEDDGKSPWTEPWTGMLGEFRQPIYGCGYLVYPGQPVGIDGPVATQRLKILRDGLDDAELLYMADKVLGREWVMERVNEATPTLTSYTTYERFAEIRKEIGDAVDAALNK